jgi:competence protein ComEA
MVFLVGLAAVLLGAHALRSLRWGTRPTELDRGLGYRVDLNQAGRAELMQIPGVGPKLAESIAEYRKKHGSFRTVDDLQHVKGVGPTRLERWRPYVWVDPDAIGAVQPPQGKQVRRPSPPGKGKVEGAKALPKKLSKKAAKLNGKIINVNLAPLSELEQLPLVGREMARRIVAERQKRPFRSVEDLKRVKRIGRKTLEVLRPHVTAP